MLVDCRYTSAAMIRTSSTLQPTTRLNSTPSSPAMPTAAAPIARFWGEIILPRTPPDELAAANSTGSDPVSLAPVACSCPNSALELVSDPVIATPIQPRIDDRNANTLPAPAIHSASVIVWPDWFIT